MKKIYAVIGAGYGDEGKGLFSDYFSSLKNKSVIIRFNGGAQAGHTVVCPSGKKHVFGHFGANSFLKNSKTILSRFFVVNPLLFKKEFFKLQDLKINPIVYCHSDAYITTPYDMIINQLLEKKRGSTKHGSCGLGFGQTVERQEVKLIDFKFKDLYLNQEELFKKLSLVRNYFIKELDNLNIKVLLNEKELDNILSDDFLHKFKQDCIDISVMIKQCEDEILVEDLKDENTQIVFEGAQGLMLDQTFGAFPYVTRSNTGIKNIVEIIKNKNVELNVIYATRCYVTRHGAGPLKGELLEKPYKRIVDNTNIDNLYQGSLRFAYLDLDILKGAIDNDLQNWVKNQNEMNVSLGVSCLDQTDEVLYVKNNIIYNVKPKLFKEKIFIEMPFIDNVIESYSETRSEIKNNERGK